MTGLSFGWIGSGRTGFMLASRLLRAGHEVVVHNRSWVHVEALLGLGARIADRPVQLAAQDIVFTTLATPEDFRTVLLGPDGLLTGDCCPLAIVDCSTGTAEVSGDVRAAAQQRGSKLITAGRPAEVEEFPWLLQV